MELFLIIAVRPGGHTKIPGFFFHLLISCYVPLNAVVGG